MTIRTSEDTDRAAIDAIHLSAFGQAQGREIVELVHALEADATAEPRLSLVVSSEAGLVGHVLFTHATVESGTQRVDAQILAPLAVHGAHQGRGNGGALVRAGLDRLAQAGGGLVFVLGDPGYYARFGFRPAAPLGLHAPYPLTAEYLQGWMVQELRPGRLGSVHGLVRCAHALDDARHWCE